MLTILIQIPEDGGLVHAPVVLSVYVLAIAVVAVVVVAHVSHLTVLVPVVRGACALVSLRWAVAVVSISHISVAVNTIFLGAPVFEVVRISLRNSSENSVFIDLIVSFHGTDGPVVGLLPNEAVSDHVPWEYVEHDAIKQPIVESIEREHIVPLEWTPHEVLTLHEELCQYIVVHAGSNSSCLWIVVVLDEVESIPDEVVREHDGWHWCPEPDHRRDPLKHLVTPIEDWPWHEKHV